MSELTEALVWALDRIEAIGGPVTEPWPTFDRARALAKNDAPTEADILRKTLAELVRLKDLKEKDRFKYENERGAKARAWEKAIDLLSTKDNNV